MKHIAYTAELLEIQTHLNAVKGDIPLHRRESKRGYSFSGLTFGEQLAIWDELWNITNNWYNRLHAYFFLERHIKKESALREMWPVIVHWQDQVDDWGLCDALAKIYTKILVVMPEEVYAQLQVWNADSNLWKRRQSVVSLLYYSRTKKQFPSLDQARALIGPLLNDKEYYVQKGVGWAMREWHTVYPDEALEWLKKHIKSVSSIAFTIAIEKMTASTIAELKALRKAV